MASKTGWSRWNEFGYLKTLCELTPSRESCPGGPGPTRLCVCVNEAPERMTLAELKAAIKRGAEVRFSGGNPELVKQVGNCGTWDFVTDTDHYHFQDVRHFRYHIEAPWTEIVG